MRSCGGRRKRADRGRDDRAVQLPLSKHRSARSSKAVLHRSLLRPLGAGGVERDAQHLDRDRCAQGNQCGGPEVSMDDQPGVRVQVRGTGTEHGQPELGG